MTTYAPRINWFNAIAAHLQARPTAKGEVWITCPQCGSPRKKFSISARGAHCFVCSYNPPLKALAEQLGVVDGQTFTPPAAKPKPQKIRDWQPRAYAIARDLSETPLTLQAWQHYKPASRTTIQKHMLGLGVFPGGLWDSNHNRRCNHPRLIVPLLERQPGQVIADVVGFRCRAIECDCTKWLSPGGSRMTLYNADRLRPGLDVLVICENPIDALLVGQEWEGAAVATLGVSIWNDSYTERVKAMMPDQVVVWFDNDASGQSLNSSILAQWDTKHPNIAPPLCGIKLTNRLLEAGLNATFYRWPDDAPAGADIGDFFK